ncbi:hypothetical protein ACLB1N_18105 [Escherichia coli]
MGGKDDPAQTRSSVPETGPAIVASLIDLGGSLPSAG